MKPQSKKDWAVILDLVKMIRTANADEREEMRDIWQGAIGTRVGRFHTYRALLEGWIGWWTHYREYYDGPIYPPLKKTEEGLHCEICQGISAMDGGWCEVCGRDVGVKDFGG